MRRPIDTTSQASCSTPTPTSEWTTSSTAITNSPDWDIEVNEKRPRPSGAASTHHVDDIVLRARRVGPGSS